MAVAGNSELAPRGLPPRSSSLSLGMTVEREVYAICTKNRNPICPLICNEQGCPIHKVSLHSIHACLADECPPSRDGVGKTSSETQDLGACMCGNFGFPLSSSPLGVATESTRPSSSLSPSPPPFHAPPPPFSLLLSEHVTTSPLHRFQPDPPCAKPKQPPTPSSVRYVPPSTLRWPVRLSRSEAALLSHLLRPNVG